MDEKIKNITKEKINIWKELKGLFTGTMEEMVAVYHEINATLTSERIKEQKDKRVKIIHDEKKSEQKNLNNIKKPDVPATERQIKYIKDIMSQNKDYAVVVSDFLIDNNVPLDNLSSFDASVLIKKMKK